MTREYSQHGKKKAMAKSLAVNGGMVGPAARAAGVSRCMHYQWLQEDPAYAQAVKDAMAMAVDVLEGEAFHRAVHGVEEPYVVGGRQVVDAEGKPLTRRKYSDRLLIQLLKGAAPEKYADRAKTESTINHTVATLPLDQLTPEQAKANLAKMLSRLETVELRPEKPAIPAARACSRFGR